MNREKREAAIVHERHQNQLTTTDARSSLPPTLDLPLSNGQRRLETTAARGDPSPRRPHSEICGDAPGGVASGSNRGQIGVNAFKMGCAQRGYSLHEFRTQGRVGQESKRKPAVVEK